MYRKSMTAGFEGFIYRSAQYYVPLGSVCLLIGYGTGDFHLILAGFIMLFFVLYLHFILYDEVHRRN